MENNGSVVIGGEDELVESDVLGGISFLSMPNLVASVGYEDVIEIDEKEDVGWVSMVWFVLLYYFAIMASYPNFLVTLLMTWFLRKLGSNDLDENDGTHVGGFRGGDVLVPSNYDETGGVAKVDVSNNIWINQYLFSLHTQ